MTTTTPIIKQLSIEISYTPSEPNADNRYHWDLMVNQNYLGAGTAIGPRTCIVRALRDLEGMYPLLVPAKETSL